MYLDRPPQGNDQVLLECSNRAKGLGRASSLVCIEHVQVERDGSSAVEATVVCQRTLENCQLAKAMWLCNTSQHSGNL